MLSRHRQIFATSVFLLDSGVLGGSWLAAYWLRFEMMHARLGVPSLSFYLWFGAVMTPFALIVLSSFRLYRSARTSRLSQELVALIEGMTIVVALAGLASYFTKGELSRGFLVTFFFIATTALLASRITIRGVLRALRRRGRNLRHVLVVGIEEPALSLLRKMRQHRDYGLVVEGLIAVTEGAVGSSVEGVPVIGTLPELPRLVESTGAELVYIALPRAAHLAEREALERLGDSTADVRLVPDLAWAFTLNAGVEDFDGMPVVLVTETPGQGWNAVLKRGFDLLLSAVGLIAISPALLALAISVKLDSPGPALYAQERVGMNGRRFRMLKFRTMRLDAEAHGPGWTTSDDPRRTRLGEILRRLSLDELPQLWNVLVGHMSLVGPRPERPMYVEQFRGRIPRYMLRHHVKAGMTGWAQVNGLRGDTPLEDRIEYDLYYIKNWSMGFDLKIIALTFARVFRDASAY
jgi:Undecaprenyl-phosphate glucose phosphotransferase